MLSRWKSPSEPRTNTFGADSLRGIWKSSPAPQFHPQESEFRHGTGQSWLKKKSHNEIPCNPEFRIIEDEHIVGILTETNQFIQLSQPIPVSEVKSHNNIPILNNDNYIVNKITDENGSLIKDKNGNTLPIVSSDVIITTTNEVDKERVEYIKKIKLETTMSQSLYP